MGLLDLLNTTKLGYANKPNFAPDQFDLGPSSTLHKTSSKDGNPAFSTYASPFLRTLTPSLLDRPEPIWRYLDHLPG
jgi:hypothetical protein